MIFIYLISGVFFLSATHSSPLSHGLVTLRVNRREWFPCSEFYQHSVCYKNDVSYETPAKPTKCALLMLKSCISTCPWSCTHSDWDC